jgi:O-antigen/teichoic acid export membrane protein
MAAVTASPVAIGSSIRRRAARAWRLIRHPPETTATEEGRAYDRERRAALTAITAMAQRAVDAAFGIASVALTVKYLGSERYGLWMTISSFVAMLGFADLGLGNGLLTAVGNANGRGDVRGAREAIASATGLLVGVAALLGLALAASYPFVSWADAFHVTSPQASAEAGPSMMVFVVCFLLNLPLGVVGRVQSGYQEGYVTNAWAVVSSLLALGGLFALVAGGAGLPLLLVALVGAPVLGSVLNGATAFTGRHRALAPRPRDFRRTEAGALLRTGLQFMVMQVCIAIVYSSGNIIVARVTTAAEVAPYAVTARMFGLPIQFYVLMLSPLWPAYTEALARGDRAWVKRTFRRTMAAAVGVSALSGLALIVAGKFLVRLWTRGEVEPPLGLLVAMAGWNACIFLGSTVATLLNAMNALRVQVITSIALTVIGTAVRVLFCEWRGPTGMVWGTTLSYVVLAFIPVVYDLRRRLGELSTRAEPA